MTDEQMSRRKHAGTTVNPQPRAKALPRSGLQKNRATSPRDTMGPYAIPIIIGIHHALKAEGHRMTVLAALISAHDLSTPFRTPMKWLRCDLLAGEQRCWSARHPSPGDLAILLRNLDADVVPSFHLGGHRGCPGTDEGIEDNFRSVRELVNQKSYEV